MSILAFVLASSTALADEPPSPPVAEARPRTVYVKMTGGRRVEGRLVGHDDETHWIETPTGVVRVRMSDVASMSDTPPEATTPEAPAALPHRRDPRTFLVIAGSVLFGLAYLGALSGIDDAEEDGFHLAIPVVGPFLYAMVTGTSGEQTGLLTFASFVQLGGLAMLTYGLAGPPPRPFVRAPE